MTGISSTCVKPRSCDVVGELVGELEVRRASGCPRAGCAATSRDAPRRSTSARAADRSCARRSSHSSSAHSCVERCTTDAFAGGTSAANATGSALMRSRPSCVRISNLYFAPSPTPGTKSSQMPDEPSERIGCRRPSQRVEVADDGDASARSAPRPRTRCRRRRRSRARARRAARRAPRGGPRIDEMEVELAERRQERVRIAQRERVAVRVLDLELVRRAAASPSAAAPPRAPPGPSAPPRRPPAARAPPAPPGGTRARRRRRRRPRARRACCAGRRRARSRQSRPPARSGAGSRRPESDPVGPVVELVPELVDGLLELEDREQPVDRDLARRQQRRVDRREVARRGTARAPAPPSRRVPARRAAARRRVAAYANERSIPATSRSGERLRRRSVSERAGSPSKSRITQSSSAQSVWPRW